MVNQRGKCFGDESCWGVAQPRWAIQTPSQTARNSLRHGCALWLPKCPRSCYYVGCAFPLSRSVLYLVVESFGGCCTEHGSHEMLGPLTTRLQLLCMIFLESSLVPTVPMITVSLSAAPVTSLGSFKRHPRLSHLLRHGVNWFSNIDDEMLSANPFEVS